MCSSQIKKLHESNGRSVLVLGRGGRPQWSEVFENNPRVVRKFHRGCQSLQNGPGMRPYIAAKSATHWTWKEWDIAPGEVWLTDAEREFAEPYRGAVLIEPHTKVAGGNKSWPWERWQKVSESGEWFIQVGTYGTPTLEGVRMVITTFRQAMAVLSVCRAAVLPEGAMHHAAAALGVPAVVLWSHYIDPRFTGYETQTNIRHADGWCGSRLPCEGCKASMDKITVEEVIEIMRAL